MSTGRRSRPGVFGVAVAACVACCIPPLLAVLGGIGVAGLLSTAFVGIAGLVVAGVAALALVVVVRRRRAPG